MSGRRPTGPSPGDDIGDYTIVERLGIGGMGEVFLAEETQPIRRRVALKVVRRGVDTRDVLARFEREQETLARLDHPHIARIHRAGVTRDGLPYFAMEYIDGVEITRFCDRHQLPLPERLRLFLQVCDAVEHAHSRGVVHRDLKPSNILVSGTGPSRSTRRG